MRRRFAPTAMSGLVAILLVLTVTACGPERDTGAQDHRGGDTASAAPESTSSSPFTIGAPPPAYTLTRAGIGTSVQDWGEDSTGTQEPFTVLAPADAEPTVDDVVVVSATGFSGYQGGLAQASPAYGDETAATEVDGRPAYLAPPAPAGDGYPARPWTDLVAERGDDLAIRVTAPGDRSQEYMERFSHATTADDDHLLPPHVDPPEGWRVIGSSSAGIHGATYVWGSLDLADQVQGPPSAHVALLEDGQDRLLVQTVPGSELDPQALIGLARMAAGDSVTYASATAEGTPTATVEMQLECRQSCGQPPRRMLVTRTEWGDTLVLVADGPTAIDADALRSVAASVQQTSPATWDQTAVAAAGGPGLHPDREAVEIARGTQGGVDWLLQALPPDRSATRAMSPSPLQSGWVPDSCLKLSTGKRTCVNGGSGTAAASVQASTASPAAGIGAPEFPGFVIVTTDRPEGVAVQVTAFDGEVQAAPLTDVPGQPGRRAAVVFVTTPGLASCPAPGVTVPEEIAAPVAAMRVEILDRSGATVSCVGM